MGAGLQRKPGWQFRSYDDEKESSRPGEKTCDGELEPVRQEGGHCNEGKAQTGDAYIQR